MTEPPFIYVMMMMMMFTHFYFRSFLMVIGSE